MSDKDSEDKISSGVSDAVLSAMFRQIKADYNIDDTRIDDLVENFSRKMTHLPIEKRLHWRGNVPSDLKKDTMTWRTFVRGIRALGALGFDLDFALKHKSGIITQHRFIKELPKPDEMEDESDEETGKKSVTDLHLFYMQIMNELGISFIMFDDLVRLCVNRITSKTANKGNARGNLKKDLLRERLSWANFIKGLVLLNITEFEFKITLKFKRSRTSTHKRKIYLPEYELSEK